MTLIQFAIGAPNDVVDAPRTPGEPDKPIPAGLVGGRWRGASWSSRQSVGLLLVRPRPGRPPPRSAVSRWGYSYDLRRDGDGAGRGCLRAWRSPSCPCVAGTGRGAPSPTGSRCSSAGGVLRAGTGLALAKACAIPGATPRPGSDSIDRSALGPRACLAGRAVRGPGGRPAWRSRPAARRRRLARVAPAGGRGRVRPRRGRILGWARHRPRAAKAGAFVERGVGARGARAARAAGWHRRGWLAARRSGGRRHAALRLAPVGCRRCGRRRWRSPGGASRSSGTWRGSLDRSRRSR